jgi:hypothetical protein
MARELQARGKMEIAMSKDKIFVTGGAVPLGSPVYISRKKDAEAFRALRNKEYLAILAPRQSGKTSLLQRLQFGVAEQYGYATALLDLSRFSTPRTDWTTWSADICENIRDQLCQGQPNVDLPRTPPRFPDFLADLATYVKAPGILILLDEAAAIPLDIRNSFYSGIRWIYNDRAAPTKPILSRYNFVFAGVFNPKTLIKTPSSPFNITQNLYLDDFSVDETAELLAHLTTIAEVEITEELVEKVYLWTGGQPYLTQVLADLLSKRLEKGDDTAPKQMIESLIPQLRKSVRVHIEHMNGPIVENQELRRWICQLVNGKSFPYEPSLNWQIAELELRGAIREGSDGQCRIRNKLYKTVIESICKNGDLAPEPDMYTPYENGVKRLLERMKPGHSKYSEGLVYQQRLNENLTHSRLYGDTPERKSTRHEIIDQLRRFASQEFWIAFNDLCY